MNLVELLEVALLAYNPLEPHLIEDYYDAETDEEPEDADAQGDTLALFIVRELRETFEPTNASDVQLLQAIDAMQKARNELEEVIAGLLTALNEET